jgi:hypothetical protein
MIIYQLLSQPDVKVRFGNPSLPIEGITNPHAISALILCILALPFEPNGRI